MKASRGVYVIQIVLPCLLVCMLAPAAMAQANFQGRWRTLIPLMPINPVHVALLHTGKVLVVAGSGNCAPGQTVPAGQPACPLGAPYGPANNSGALLYDPSTNSFTQFSLSWNMFCNGMVVLPDGQRRTAKLVASDKSDDLALVRLTEPPAGLEVPPIRWAEPSALRVGKLLVAVGRSRSAWSGRRQPANRADRERVRARRRTRRTPSGP